MASSGDRVNTSKRIYVTGDWGVGVSAGTNITLSTGGLLGCNALFFVSRRGRWLSHVIDSWAKPEVLAEEKLKIENLYTHLNQAVADFRNNTRSDIEQVYVCMNGSNGKDLLEALQGWTRVGLPPTVKFSFDNRGNSEWYMGEDLVLRSGRCSVPIILDYADDNLSKEIHLNAKRIPGVWNRPFVPSPVWKHSGPEYSEDLISDSGISPADAVRRLQEEQIRLKQMLSSPRNFGNYTLYEEAVAKLKAVESTLTLFSMRMTFESRLGVVSRSLEMPHAMLDSRSMLLSGGPATLHHSSPSSPAISVPPERFPINGSEARVVHRFKLAANANDYPGVIEAIQECINLGRTGIGNMKVIALLISGDPGLLKVVAEHMTIPESRTVLLQIANETSGCEALKEILKPKPTFTP